MKAIFEITADRLRAVPTGILTAQVSRALEQRAEYLSRERFDGIWKGMDQLRNVPPIPKCVLKKRLFRKKVLNVLCFALGIFVLVPGLVEPRDLNMVVIGIAAIFLSVFNLWSIRKRKKPQFEKPAEQLIETTLFAFPETASLRITFSDSGLVLEDVVDGVLQNLQEVPYSEFECVTEMDDLYFLTYSGKGTILPKNCMTAGSAEEFRTFLAAQTTVLRS